MAPFQYRPLNEARVEIRVLRLQPASYGDCIKFSVQHVPLHETPPTNTNRSTLKELENTLPPGWIVYETLEGRYIFENEAEAYCSWSHPDHSIDKATYSYHEASFDQVIEFEALSYTWGNENETTPVQVSDLDTGECGHLLVRPNLATALRHLRLADKERILWIDAICIDQSNVKERGTQVKRMDRIYRLAKQVNVWLGETSNEENSDRAMNILEYVGAQVEYTRDQSYIEAPSCTEKNWYRPDIEIPLADLEAIAIKKLLERPWFSRLWIWQEIQLANASARIYCGHKSISWYHFRRAILALDVKQQINTLLPRSLLAQISSLAFSRRSTATLKLLWATQYALCSDKRDRIYAILGLLQPQFSSLVDPDYSTSSATVYQKACESWVKAYDKLSFLEFCDLQERNDRRPSWVPDWSTGLSREPMTFSRFASGRSGTGGAKIINGNLLEVFGVVCGVIDWKEDAGLRARHGFWEYWRDLERKLHTSGEVKVINKAHREAFVAMLCGNRIREMYPTHIYWPTIAECLEIFLAAEDGREEDDDIEFNAFENSVREFTNGRFCFRTRDHMGFASPSVTKGDILAVLLGFDAPVILRRQANGHYTFVSEAYVHGLMNGEAILGSFPAGWQVQAERSKQGLMIQAFSKVDSPAELIFEDPRLENLSTGWAMNDTETLQSSSFFNGADMTHQDDSIGNDPRLNPETLSTRGVKLETFRIC